MSQFLKVKSFEEVLGIIRDLEPLEAERVQLHLACGRMLAEAVSAPESVPHFDRATMDGYAVRARDTFGASESLPALLDVGGEILMGEATPIKVEPGKAIAVPTGGMLPAGADAVVMVEYTYTLDSGTIEVTRPVAPGDNVLMEGEDIREGEPLFPAGWRLRGQDIGVLAALGITEASVYRRPRVAIISTGDEIVPASTPVLPYGKIRDINSFTLACLVESAGGIVCLRAIIEDNLDELLAACRSAIESHDVLILSGGSSVGARDFTLRILDNIPGAELLIHGVAIRPGKPTILARIGKKIFWGLPGQPMSAMMICRAFVMPCVYSLQGGKELGLGEGIADARRAVLTRQLPSVHGRTDYVPVVLVQTENGWQATPVFGKSATISTLARSDGYIIVPEHVEGLDQGITVTVHLFQDRVELR